MPWVFTTFDVGVLIHCLELFALVIDMPLADALHGPGVWLIFLYLAMAALRYRPFLVLYAGLLFTLGWLAVWFLASNHLGSSELALSHSPTHGDTSSSELARFAVMAVTIVALGSMTARNRASVRLPLTEARLRATLARYFAGGVVSELAEMPESGRRLREQHAAILFADIRGFTSLAEAVPADDVASLLSEYRDRIAAPIAKYGGIIDKFIGDGVMVVFGVPRSGPHDARNALLCALALQATVSDWNRERGRVGHAPIEIGIGIHFGPVVAGVLGGRDRLEFTVIGDTVNVAGRLDDRAAELGLSILISSEVRERAGDERQNWGLVGDLALRGRRSNIRVYGLLQEVQSPQGGDAARSAGRGGQPSPGEIAAPVEAGS